MFPDLVVSADLLGSGVFGFVQADIKGNIEERRRFSIHTFFFFLSGKKLILIGPCREFARAIGMLRRVRRRSRISSEAKCQKAFVMEPLVWCV